MPDLLFFGRDWLLAVLGIPRRRRQMGRASQTIEPERDLGNSRAEEEEEKARVPSESGDSKDIARAVVKDMTRRRLEERANSIARGKVEKIFACG